MRQSLPLLLAAVVLLSPNPANADDSVTAADLVKLSAAGLGDDILVALIESHDTVFKLSASDILDLRERGLSRKVILAMLQTATRSKSAAKPVESQLPPVPADVTTLDVRPLEPPPSPVVVNVTQQVEQHVEQPRSPDRYDRTLYTTIPVAVPVYVRPHVPEKKPEPVYWGFGGQRRPDTWRDRKDK